MLLLAEPIGHLLHIVDPTIIKMSIFIVFLFFIFSSIFVFLFYFKEDNSIF